MAQAYPFAEGERAAIRVALNGVGAEAIRYWLNRRGYATFAEIDPHRRLSVAAGIVWDAKNAAAH